MLNYLPYIYAPFLKILGIKDKNLDKKYRDLQIDPSVKYDPNPVTVVKELSRL